MKQISFITVFIAGFTVFCLGANGFKEGNKLYLGGKYQDALSQYQEYIQKNPEQYEGFFNAGNAFFRQEQYDNALGMYKKAQEINAKDPDIQHNIEVTQKKIEQKKSECKNPKSGDEQKNQDKNQQGKNSQQGGEDEQGNQAKNSDPKTQEGQKSESAKASPGKQQAQQQKGAQESKQPPSGMTEDEVQALLNQKQNQEKRLQGYFGKQYPKQNQDMFNMSPEEIMQYMMQKQMDPNFEPQQKQGGGGNAKDW